MRDRPIDGGQKLKKKGDESGNGLCWLEREKKDSREILPHLLWFDYELCLVVKDALCKMCGGREQ